MKNEFVLSESIIIARRQTQCTKNAKIINKAPKKPIQSNFGKMKIKNPDNIRPLQPQIVKTSIFFMKKI